MRLRPRRNLKVDHATLPECGRQNGRGQLERLTYFSDYPGYRASELGVSDDGQFMACQMARSKDPAGSGNGILLQDLRGRR